MTREEIIERMEEVKAASDRASQTYAARVTLFGVAASANDKEGMERERALLHDAVDVMLDASMNYHDLNRMLYALPRK